MRIAYISILAAFAALALRAEQPADKPATPPVISSEAEAFIAKFMAFDKNKDGKLTRDEITDERFLRLFDKADTNKDGVVTKEELSALAIQETASANNGPAGGGPGPGGGGPGFGPGGGGGGPRGGMNRPQPGQILSGGLQDQLKLSDDQKKQLADMQKDVDAKLDKLLTDDQKTQLKTIRERGPGRGPGGGGPPDGGGGGPGNGPGGPGGDRRRE
ncbi:MAG TPA: EF-hand domain-containing protein [Planctomycetota bacterium]|nr:EF-hand domain-containing protein [Planctomycetota bacterium]